MGKRSTCLYIDKEVLEAAKKMGLNVSKACENALVEIQVKFKKME